jgi:hypothetical protein
MTTDRWLNTARRGLYGPAQREQAVQVVAAAVAGLERQLKE